MIEKKNWKAVEAEVEVDVHSEPLNSNNGISRHNRNRYYVDAKNGNKMIGNTVGYDGEYLDETKEPQQKIA